MDNQQSKVRKPSTLQQYKSEISQNIEELQSRIDKLNAELDDVKAEMKSSIDNLDDPEFQKELTRITSLRETAAEMLSERQQELEQLNAELEKLLAKQQREDNFNKAVKLAITAEKKRTRQNELVKQFDEAVAPILNELADLRTEWKAKSFTFMRTLSELEPSFRKRISENLSKEERSEHVEVRKELLQKIADDASVPTDAARREGYLDWKQWNNLFKTELDIQKSEYGALGLVGNVLRKRSQQAERKKRQQMRELQNEAKEVEAAE